jgi:hypothetical protein
VFQQEVKTPPPPRGKTPGGGLNRKEKIMLEQPMSFPLGRTVITANALDVLQPEDVQNALRRHTRGDWGDVCSEDARSNDAAMLEGCRLLSAFRDRHGVKFWIITEADRSVTTVLLPEDY